MVHKALNPDALFITLDGTWKIGALAHASPVHFHGAQQDVTFNYTNPLAPQVSRICQVRTCRYSFRLPVTCELR